MLHGGEISFIYRRHTMLEQTLVIQGGMGVNVSSPKLAHAVSSYLGGVALGTVSGAAAPHVLAHLLGQGDLEGQVRRAFASFPFRESADRVLERYFVEGGKQEHEPYPTVPVFSLRPSRSVIELAILASYTLVWLAKEGHTNPVSINYLEKIQTNLVYGIYGAMLAGVDVVTVGAGIPFQVPAVLDAYAHGQPGSYRVSVLGGKSTSVTLTFDPSTFFPGPLPQLTRPAFLPIVSTDSLANILVNKAPHGIQGFVVETSVAGGHNAGPRGNPKCFNERGEPIYGEKDQANYERMQKLGIPFWIGGGYASPKGLLEAQSVGAQGIQAGTIFALCEESGMIPTLKSEVRRLGFRGELDVLTSLGSPTGFPFKVVNHLAGTLTDTPTYTSRKRICNTQYLVDFHERTDGRFVQRCTAEPIHKFESKGGNIGDTNGKFCLCNGLLATAGLGNPGEPPIVTLGDTVDFLGHLMTNESDGYTASDALRYLLGG